MRETETAGLARGLARGLLVAAPGSGEGIQSTATGATSSAGAGMGAGMDGGAVGAPGAAATAVPPHLEPQRAVFLLASSGAFDSRALRLAESLACRGHQVTILARLREGLPELEERPEGIRVVRLASSPVDGLPLPEPLRRSLEAAWRRRPRAPTGGETRGTLQPPRRAGRMGRLLAGSWRMAAVALETRSFARRAWITAPPADLVVAVGLVALPAGRVLARRDGAPLVYDAADVYVEAGNLARLPRPLKLLLARLERRWAGGASLVTTANDAYAAILARRLGRGRPLVLLNTPRWRPAPQHPPRLFHQRLGLPPEVRVVLYHGGFSPERGIEVLLDAVPRLEATVLVLLGYGALEGWLREEITRRGLASRVFVLPAVPPEELLAWVASADVAALPIQPTTLNHRYTLPNKLFEAMAAGTPVVAADLPGMAPIVRGEGIGVTCDPTDPQAVAAALHEVLDAPAERREEWRERARQAARRRYAWEHEEPRWLAALTELTGRLW